VGAARRPGRSLNGLNPNRYTIFTEDTLMKSTRRMGNARIARVGKYPDPATPDAFVFAAVAGRYSRQQLVAVAPSPQRMGGLMAETGYAALGCWLPHEAPPGWQRLDEGELDALLTGFQAA
jgi:hypothetical protein